MLTAVTKYTKRKELNMGVCYNSRGGFYNRIPNIQIRLLIALSRFWYG